jgi:hypothetical protein
MLRYLHGTIEFGLSHIQGDGVKLVGYLDVDWVGNSVDRKSTSGCCFNLGSGAISWFSRKQKSVALSSAEAEYIAANLASCEAIWLQKLLMGLFDQVLDTTVIHCDNQSCIKLFENLVFHDRSKHIDRKSSSVDRKSTSGCCFNLGSGAISWFSRKQKSVALSSAEAEYMAASLASFEAIWLQKLLMGLFDQVLDTTVIHCDNQSCIKLFENLVFYDRPKHIEIRYHFIRDCVQKGFVKLQYVPTGEQIADILTKPLVKGKFVYFRDKLGVVQNTFLAKREC